MATVLEKHHSESREHNVEKYRKHCALTQEQRSIWRGRSKSLVGEEMCGLLAYSLLYHTTRTAPTTL